MITGGVGQAVASPTDVVKVRLQADGRLKAVGKAPRYQVRESFVSTLHCWVPGKKDSNSLAVTV